MVVDVFQDAIGWEVSLVEDEKVVDKGLQMLVSVQRDFFREYFVYPPECF